MARPPSEIPRVNRMVYASGSIAGNVLFDPEVGDGDLGSNIGDRSQRADVGSDQALLNLLVGEQQQNRARAQAEHQDGHPIGPPARCSPARGRRQERDPRST